MALTDDEIVGSIQRLATRSAAAPGAVLRCQQALGFRLDPFLVRIYDEAADGGFGPGLGAISISDGSLAHTYAEFISHGLRSGWPEGLLPIWNWGDAIWSCIDKLGRIVTHDGVDGATLTDFDVRSWLTAWLSGADMWSSIYEDKDGTIINPFTKKPVTTRIRGKVKGRPWPLAQGQRTS
jgi:hypothetical protein